VLADVADQPDDVVGRQAPDRAGGVDADNDAAPGPEHEACGLQEPADQIDERAGSGRDRRGAGAVPDREGEAELGDQRGSGRLVID
jgi:hypothetical protein